MKLHQKFRGSKLGPLYILIWMNEIFFIFKKFSNKPVLLQQDSLYVMQFTTSKTWPYRISNKKDLTQSKNNTNEKKKETEPPSQKIPRNNFAKNTKEKFADHFVEKRNSNHACFTLKIHLRCGCGRGCCGCTIVLHRQFNVPMAAATHFVWVAILFERQILVLHVAELKPRRAGVFRMHVRLQVTPVVCPCVCACARVAMHVALYSHITTPSYSNTNQSPPPPSALGPCPGLKLMYVLVRVFCSMT